MTRHSILVSALVLSFVMAALHILSLEFYFYWVYWWYDVAVHFLAGMTGGFAVYWFIFYSDLFHKRFHTPKHVFAIVLASVMFMGVAWEVFEYIVGTTDSIEGYHIDTMNDLILDGSGAVLAILLSSRKKHNG